MGKATEHATITSSCAERTARHLVFRISRSLTMRVWRLDWNWLLQDQQNEPNASRSNNIDVSCRGCDHLQTTCSAARRPRRSLGLSAAAICYLSELAHGVQR